MFVQPVCKMFGIHRTLHRLAQPQPGRVQVRVRRLDVGVAEQLLDVVNRHPALEPPGSGLVPQIVEVQIDRLQDVAARRRFDGNLAAKDGYFPRTGREKPDGSDERVTLATYFRSYRRCRPRRSAP